MKIRHWILASRPKTLMAGGCPVAIGASLAVRDEVFHLASATAALVGAMAIQIGTNFCNDYFDFYQGADTDARKGPTRAVQAGLIKPQLMLRATLLAFGIAATASCYLSLRAGWPIAVLAVLSILFGVMYTAGRYSLAYLGIADPFVLLFFGPIAVAGTYYVQALELPMYAIAAGIAPGAIATGLLVVNNLRDVDEDRAAGKKTLVVRLGKLIARMEYALCILTPAAFSLLLLNEFEFGRAILVLAATSLLLGLIVIHEVRKRDGAELNPCLGMTAAYLFGYSLLFSAGSALLWW